MGSHRLDHDAGATTTGLARMKGVGLVRRRGNYALDQRLAFAGCPSDGRRHGNGCQGRWHRRRNAALGLRLQSGAGCDRWYEVHIFFIGAATATEGKAHPSENQERCCCAHRHGPIRRRVVCSDRGCCNRPFCRSGSRGCNWGRNRFRSRGRHNRRHGGIRPDGRRFTCNLARRGPRGLPCRWRLCCRRRNWLGNGWRDDRLGGGRRDHDRGRYRRSCHHRCCSHRHLSHGNGHVLRMGCSNRKHQHGGDRHGVAGRYGVDLGHEAKTR